MIYNNIINEERRMTKSMAATLYTEKIAVNLLLNNGTTTTGGVRTATVGLGKMSKTGFDADKVLAIVNLLSPCLSKPVHEVVRVATDQITN